ncbi:unnamed protein product [Vitrella brassicaformis CCMP3155]|uniref:Uncharacterized protein n=1 Tax=Vitrella brassicaformis (strain CCMP3155) TaxID=1169540 RepID=A0A0G4G3Q7_VITBC|nr:unnamed protein product [Vitrella brassicaformis CCMP3155]|eukprot:CEM22582.1 unnamed protein product [Vitrella brassicaformis CCMP3155]
MPIDPSQWKGKRTGSTLPMLPECRVLAPTLVSLKVKELIEADPSDGLLIHTIKDCLESCYDDWVRYMEVAQEIAQEEVNGLREENKKLKTALDIWATGQAQEGGVASEEGDRGPGVLHPLLKTATTMRMTSRIRRAKTTRMLQIAVYILYPDVPIAFVAFESPPLASTQLQLPGAIRRERATNADGWVFVRRCQAPPICSPYAASPAKGKKKLAGNRFSVFIDDDESDIETKADGKKKRKNKKKMTKSSTESPTKDGASPAPAPAQDDALPAPPPTTAHEAEAEPPAEEAKPPVDVPTATTAAAAELRTSSIESLDSYNDFVRVQEVKRILHETAHLQDRIKFYRQWRESTENLWVDEKIMNTKLQEEMDRSCPSVAFKQNRQLKEGPIVSATAPGAPPEPMHDGEEGAPQSIGQRQQLETAVDGQDDGLANDANEGEGEGEAQAVEESDGFEDGESESASEGNESEEEEGSGCSSAGHSAAAESDRGAGSDDDADIEEQQDIQDGASPVSSQDDFHGDDQEAEEDEGEDNSGTRLLGRSSEHVRCLERKLQEEMEQLKQEMEKLKEELKEALNTSAAAPAPAAPSEVDHQHQVAGAVQEEDDGWGQFLVIGDDDAAAWEEASSHAPQSTDPSQEGQAKQQLETAVGVPADASAAAASAYPPHGQEDGDGWGTFGDDDDGGHGGDDEQAERRAVRCLRCQVRVESISAATLTKARVRGFQTSPPSCCPPPCR